MKKHTLGLMVLLALLAASCKKHNTINGGTWTFKGTTYEAEICSSNTSVVVLSNSFLYAGPDTGTAYSLVITFSSRLLPTTSGTDTVVHFPGFPSTYNQVEIGVMLGTTGYYAPGGNGNNQTVKVTVSSAGKVSVSGSNIMMVNGYLPSDSAPLSFNISQTN